MGDWEWARPSARDARVLRRAGDVALASIGLLVATPVLALISLIILLDSPGPVIYLSPRLGLRGKHFVCYKFRTMYTDGDARLSTYLASSREAQMEWQTYAKLRGYDPRVTRTGRWLRKLSLDEVPQLINVLLGQMTLVGPRPYLPRELPDMGDAAKGILSVKPGLTGLWQVSGRNELSFSQRVELEARYVAQRTVLLDLMILFRTAGVVIRRRGAF